MKFKDLVIKENKSNIELNGLIKKISELQNTLNYLNGIAEKFNFQVLNLKDNLEKGYMEEIPKEYKNLFKSNISNMKDVSNLKTRIDDIQKELNKIL